MGIWEEKIGGEKREETSINAGGQGKPWNLEKAKKPRKRRNTLTIA